MDNWDEIRTAYQVARLGTVSGAAEALGVHHATVIRHVDALEGRLGVKLFQRHARGYTATEAGRDLLQVAQVTDDQFTQLFGRIRGRGDGVTGDLVITSLADLSPLLTPVLVAFQRENPGLIVRYLTGTRVFRLEYGEAHVAIRSGSMPEQLDNVVQPLGKQGMVLVASSSYAEAYGLPASEADLPEHWFVSDDESTSRAPFNRWLADLVPRERIIFRSVEATGIRDAILAGAGIGFMPRWDVAMRDDLHEVATPRPEWEGPLWLVTHVDLHRTTKVRAFTAFLKERAKSWPA